MIIGNGLIAKAFKDMKDYTIFASGVSNSNITDKLEFKREEELLLSYKNNHLIYFSSIFSNINTNAYFVHKNNMENIICSNFSNYYIFRLPQIIGNGGNNKNLINIFVDSINDNKEIKVLNTYRSIIDIDDLVRIVNYIVSNKPSNKIYDLAHIEYLSVIEIVNIIEKLLNKNAIIIQDDAVNIHNKLNNSIEIEEAINVLIDRNDYTEKILNKYVIYRRENT